MKKLMFMLVTVTVLFKFVSAGVASMMNAPDVYGLTARGMGVGNAMTACPGDISDAYYNPAGVALINAGQISLGYIYADPSLEITANGNTYNDIKPLNRIAEIGYALNLSRLMNRQVVLAQELSVDNNSRTLAVFDDGANPNGNFFRYGYTNLMLLTSMGINVLPWLYVGGGISAYLGANTTMNTTTTLNGQTSNSSIALNTSGKFSSLAGILLSPLGGLVTVGITYREGHIFNLGPISAIAASTVGGSPLVSLPLNLYFKDGFVPTQWAFGFSFRPSDRLRFLFDLTYYQWSWLNKLESSGDYAKTGINLDMKDTYAPRVGLELQPLDNLYARVGYQYLPSPLHGSTGTLNWVDSPQQVWSIGVGYNIAPISPEYPMSIDAVYQYHYLNKTSFPFSSGYIAQAKGDINALGITLTMRY
ncbi:MAG: OmpP1/FadL family transporter [bacterium]